MRPAQRSLQVRAEVYELERWLRLGGVGGVVLVVLLSPAAAWAQPLTGRAMALAEYAATVEADRPSVAGRLSPSASRALWLCAAADTASTIYALGQGHTEANPLYGPQPSAAKLVAGKLAAISLAWLMMRATAKTHPETASTVTALLGMQQCAVATWNVGQTMR
jgi:hypothetical protein